MGKIIGLVLALAAFVLPATASGGEQKSQSPPPGGESPRSPAESIIPNRYIVVLKDSVAAPGQVARDQLRAKGGELGLVYRHALKGYSAKLSATEAKALRRDPRVRYVTPDRRVEAFEQQTPTGIDRIFAPGNETLDIDAEEDEWVDADVAVIDTGIDDFEQPELNVVARTICIPLEFSAETNGCEDDEGVDANGHGTHVAGTIGAVDDGSGVVGVAPGARLWGVKVLSDWGAGAESWIVAGVDWVTAHAAQIEVANMSIGCGPFLNEETEALEACVMPVLDEAIESSVDAGVVHVVAAGNSAVDAKYVSPARNPDVITVSAVADYDGEPGGLIDPPYSPFWCEEKHHPEELDVGADDTLASFSNFGSAVEVAAPGVCIRSTGHNGGLSRTLSGTSMASPHVAGAAAILASADNPESRADVEAIREAIVEAGNSGWTDTSGDGVHEPLLDVADEEAFEAQTIEGELPVPGEAKWDYMQVEEKASTLFEDVSCTSATACVALVNNVRSGHWDGEEWTFSSISGFGSPKAVSCSAADECTAVGNHEVEGNVEPAAWRWDGEEWSAQSVPTGPEWGWWSGFSGVSCPGPQFCIAVGKNVGAGIHWTETMVQRWDGEEWSIVPSPNHPDPEGATGSENLLDDVSCIATDDCLAVGFYGHVVEYGPGPWGALLLRWDGEEWTPETGPESLGDPRAVSCPAAEACVVLDETARAAHWDGEEWSLEWLPRPLQDVSCSSADACMAVGEAIAAFGSGFGAQAVRWDGERWNREVTADPFAEDLEHSPLSSISCTQVPAGCIGVGWSRPEGGGKVPHAEARLANPPVATTEPATEVRAKQATLNALVNPSESHTDYSFEYGTTTAYGKAVPLEAEPVGQGAEDVAVEETLSGLKPGTTYHFRVSASNYMGTTHGEDLTFTTKAAVPPVYASSFGKYGASPGDLAEPTGIAVDPSGNVWVADTENNRIEKFSPSGEFILASGSYGTGNGQFSTPRGIAVDPSGNVWVADTFNNRVQKFDSSGKYVSQFGTKGSGNGQLSQPWGIDVDSEGKVWVVDPGNERVQRFSSGGVYETKFSTFGPAIGIAADGEGGVWVSESLDSRVRRYTPAGEALVTIDSGAWGEFAMPHGLAVDATGNVWIADTSNHRVRAFAADGTYLTQFGSQGSAAGQMSYPEDLAFDVDGALRVLDAGNSRVQKWSFGAPEATTEAASGMTEAAMTLNATVNPEGKATTYRFDYGLTTSYGMSAPASPESIGSGAENVAVSETVEGLLPGRTYHFRVAATNSVGTSYGQDFTATTKTAAVTYSSAFGSNGTGNGQLKSPADTAVDSKGNVWVADRLNHRIQKFSPAGEYLTQFGTKGSANGQLNEPAGIAIDAQDNIWVAEIGNHRLQKFSSAGAHLAKFGSYGTGNGQFGTYGPKGVAIDPQGNLWASDYSGRIQKFNSSGEFQKAVGSQGSGDGQFGQSTGIDAGPGGKIWVADWQHNRVSVFSEAGEFLFKFGSEGSANGQFNRPDGLEVDSRGNVWVSEEGNDRVQLFDQAGQHVATFGSKGAGAGQFELAWPTGLSADDKGNLWVADISNHRIQRWLVPNYVPVFKASFGANGSGNGQLKTPGDVARDAAGNLWVVDKGNNRVQKFSPSGEYLGQFGAYGSGNGQFDRPTSIAIGPSGHIWVADGENDRVQKFSSSGTYLSQFGTYGSGNGQFKEPEAIATDAQGNVWVCDTLNGRIQKFTEAGSFVKVVGSQGSGNGQLGQCTGIDVGPGGKVWAADWVYNRVSVFSEAGEFLFRFGTSGTAGGQFAHPEGVEIDFAGNVWVGDEGNNRVQLFNQSGEYVTAFGAKGSGEGQFSFSWPMSLTSDDNGNLWVADVANNRVQRWAYAP